MTNREKSMEFVMQAARIADEKKEDTLSLYDKALELDPTNNNAWYNKGVTLRKIGQFPEALNCFEKTVEYAPMSIQKIWAEEFIEEIKSRCNKGNKLK